MISVFCSEKLDGVAAAAVVMRHAMLQRLPAHFGGFLHPDSLDYELNDMARLEHQLIFIVDIPVSPDNLPALDKVCKKNKLVYWNTPEVESVVPPAKIFDKSIDRKSATEIAQRRFLPNDMIAKRLAELAHQVKFWQIQDETSTRLADLIAAQYSPVELLDNLAKGVIWNPQFELFHKEFMEKKRSALDELMKTIVIKSYVKYRFGFAFASSILTTADACQRMLDGHAGIDVAIVLYRDGRLGFRRRDGCDVDVKKLAELFNGGGKEFAAGAKLNIHVSKDSLPDAIFQLDQAFKNFFVGVIA